MKCPSCTAPCLATDDICPGCRRPLYSSVVIRQRSAMYFTVPLFLGIAIILFFAVPLYNPVGTKGLNHWDQIGVAVLTAAIAGVSGAGVGWLLDWIAGNK
jgi:hypothetical protein